jgi:hypothetical protein
MTDGLHQGVGFHIYGLRTIKTVDIFCCFDSNFEEEQSAGEGGGPGEG